MVEWGSVQMFLKWHWPWVLVLTQLSLLLFWSQSPHTVPQHCFSSLLVCPLFVFSTSIPSRGVHHVLLLTLCLCCSLWLWLWLHNSCSSQDRGRFVWTVWLHLKGSAGNCSQVSHWAVHLWGISSLCFDSSRLRMVLGSKKKMIVPVICLWGCSPFLVTILAFKSVVNGNIAPCLLPSFLVVLMISRSYFCSHPVRDAV